MSERIDPPYCDKNDPRDPNYPNRHFGDYNNNCVWVWDIGLLANSLQVACNALKDLKK